MTKLILLDSLLQEVVATLPPPCVTERYSWWPQRNKREEWRKRAAEDSCGNHWPGQQERAAPHGWRPPARRSYLQRGVRRSSKVDHLRSRVGKQVQGWAWASTSSAGQVWRSSVAGESRRVEEYRQGKETKKVQRCKKEGSTKQPTSRKARPK